MSNRSLLSAACAAIALIAAAPALAQVPPAPVPADAAAPDAFTYQDMISANRLGDPRVVTTTDVEANSRAGSLWMLDLDTPEQAPRRLAISDQGANTARWGGDGNLDFLSGKSGTSQGWRVASPTATPVQVTSLPLDVNAYRVSPTGDKVAVSLAVYPDAAVVHIVPKETPEAVRAATLESLTAAAFGQRRKMLRRSLQSLPGALEALDRLGIDPARRAETLSVDEFVAIARELTP